MSLVSLDDKEGGNWSIGSQTPAKVESVSYQAKGILKGWQGWAGSGAGCCCPTTSGVALAASVEGREKEKLLFTTGYSISLLLWKRSKASVPCVEYT